MMVTEYVADINRYNAGYIYDQSYRQVLTPQARNIYLVGGAGLFPGNEEWNLLDPCWGSIG